MPLTLSNQKMDLGPCPKIHNEKVAAAFKADREKNPSDPRFAAFEQEYQNNIYAFVEDCDRKIRASQRRLEKTPEENAKGVNLVSTGSGCRCDHLKRKGSEAYRPASTHR